MIIEARVSFRDQLFIEALFVAAGLVRADQENCFAVGIEGEGYALDAIICVAPQFFQICVSRSFERINMRPSKMWSEFFDQSSLRGNRCLCLSR